jgi:hypothetical protein
MFFDFCDAYGGLRRRFQYKQITLFFEWYVAGVDNHKLRAHTTLAQYQSAFFDHALEHGLHYPGARTRRRITKFIKGLANRFPHVKLLEHPLLLQEIVRIGAAMGITSNDTLERCSTTDLIFWARIITAHDATLRAVEHSAGMQVKDFTITHGRAFLTVGRRETERKLNHQTRTVPLPNDNDYTCSGYVLRVLKRRVHGRGVSGDNCLFPKVLKSTALSAGRPVPWETDRRRLEGYARSIGIRGRIGGRSLRAGGTTDYFNVEASRQFVKHQGGWLSDAFLRYDRPTPEGRHRLAEKYARRLRSILSA